MLIAYLQSNNVLHANLANMPTEAESVQYLLRRRDLKREDFNPPFFTLFAQMIFWYKKT